MKTKCGFVAALFAVLASLCFESTAVAETYKIKRGDTLGKIARKSGCTVDQIMAANKGNIKHKDRIRENQVIEIPEGEVVPYEVRLENAKKKAVSGIPRRQTNKDAATVPSETNIFEAIEGISEFQYKNPGADKYRGDLELALDLLRYPEVVKEIFRQKVANGEGVSEQVNHSQLMAAMVFGKATVRFNVRGNWKDSKEVLGAVKYTAVVDNVKYTLVKMVVCRNWTRLFDLKLVPPEVLPEPKPAVEPEPAPEPIPVTPAPEPAPEPPPPPAPAPVEPPVLPPAAPADIPVTIAPLPLPEPTECDNCEHEPILTVGGWGNQLAEGFFGAFEYTYWWKVDPSQQTDWWKKLAPVCWSELSLGVGFFSSLEDGNSKVSDYQWNGYQIGPQIGIKRSWSEDEMLRQWVAKFRFTWENMSGFSDESGYEQRQEHYKLGLYAERVHQYNSDWTGILSGEAWIPLGDGTIDSTWTGDKPQGRSFVGMGAYAQYKVNDDISLRGGTQLFYQGWDELWGLNLRAELRYKNTVMIGPYLTFFPNLLTNVSNIAEYYPDANAWDLTTLGWFVRVEFGEIIRNEIERKKARRVTLVKQADVELISDIGDLDKDPVEDLYARIARAKEGGGQVDPEVIANVNARVDREWERDHPELQSEIREYCVQIGYADAGCNDWRSMDASP